MIELLKEWMCKHEWKLDSQLQHYQKKTLEGYVFICMKCGKVKKQMI